VFTVKIITKNTNIFCGKTHSIRVFRNGCVNRWYRAVEGEHRITVQAVVSHKLYKEKEKHRPSTMVSLYMTVTANRRYKKSGRSEAIRKYSEHVIT